MSSYIHIHGKCEDKRWWNDLVRACAVVGDSFEIHCWSDERDEVKAALQYGQRIPTSWHGGVVIRGRITKDFLSFLTDAKKPTDTQIYNKMTPFFTIIIGKHLHSEHYGLSRVAREKQPVVDKILDRLEKDCIVHRNLD